MPDVRPARAALVVLAMQLLVAAAVPAAAHGAGAPRLGGCPVFPASNVWNQRVDALPVRDDSETLKRSIGLAAHLHPDFGAWQGYGIPFNIVSRQTRRVAVKFLWPAESDRIRYPIPRKVKREGGSDRHILMLDRTRCRLYELFAARRQNGSWRAGSGATWNLRSNQLRPSGWTSADAAGLPILPGLVRFAEVRRGHIGHALRFTAPQTRRAFIYPARHYASDDDDVALPPMGLRVRLKADVDISGYPYQARVILQALKEYGMILADNGSPWYVTGAPHPRWNDDALHTLHDIKGSDLEVVDTDGLRNG